ncbi:DNA repair exonuclease SbcCD ATPase subunit [Prosthecobacter fusiformis]|uniref:DNA repair exonuclease SbcCD ATPase subunit n=1 Tax=Prosthecobacter fusiformis TaxID=48464 RepID=A0A4V3FI30_9BACT|nr:AAA family ATPase [Prosthecobacter fusiformis]TDU80833.1 DNA repair exonuclease SbcCD ATPase subunit [Prosthecobacter fusiformis]
MRLHSITVRHYRRHLELRVDLDPARTLIGGPNESGKSTLVEATHRALFLRAKGNSKEHKEMLSLTHGGKPEVELEFEAEGRRYTLVKSFKGAGGMARLTQAGGSSWQGDEAEERLASLLKVNGGGRKSGEQWSHLWVWQGSSANDPLIQANTERESLVQRLQSQGGAAVIQSPLDARIAEHFAVQMKVAFQEKGEPRKNSDLGQALQAEEVATEAETVAQASVQKLQQAILQHEQAAVQMAEAEAALRHMESERAALAHRSAEVNRLRQVEQEAGRQVQAARKAYEARLATQQTIEQLQRNLDSLLTELAPQQARQESLTQSVATARKLAAECESSSHAAEDVVSNMRALHDYALALSTLAEKERHLLHLTRQEQVVNDLLAKRAELEKKIGTLPKIDPATLTSLQALERAQDKALTLLNSVATEIELLTTDVPVQVGDQELKAGLPLTLTTDTDVLIGNTKLRLRPGGGTSLAEARAKEKEARRKLDESFTTYGVKSLQEAVAISAERDRLQGDWKALTAELKGLAYEKLQADLTEAKRSFAAAETEVAHRRQDDFPANPNPVETKLALAAAETALQTCRLQRDQAASSLKKHEAALNTQAEALRENMRRLEEVKIRLTVLNEHEGPDNERAEALKKAALDVAQADAQLASAHQDLQFHHPDDLPSDQARFDRAHQSQSDKKADAQKRHIEAATLLRSDGTTDPTTALALATARAQAARANREAAHRHAYAMRRVHELILEEQHTLADRFTRPLAERVEGYLQRLFGPGVSVTVTMQNNSFEGLSLSRQGQPAFSFETLSQGASEQVAAAFRLAMAEILAESHNGCLPVVFDDAFAHSDPARVQSLHRMLDLAATRGLQIILLTCTPADYAMMGAAELRLDS